MEPSSAHRRTADQRQRSKARPERTQVDFALVDQRIHCQRHGAPIAPQDQGDPRRCVAGERRFGADDGLQRHERNDPVLEQQHLPAFDRRDVAGIDAQHAIDRGEVEPERVRADGNQHNAVGGNGQRQAQHERGAARRGAYRHRAAQRFDLGPHDVEADAAARKIGYARSGRDAGHEDSLREVVVAELDAAFAHALAQTVEVEAPAVIAHAHLERADLQLRRQPHDPLGRFSAPRAFGRSFNAVIDRVAHQLDQRIAQAVDGEAIDADLRAPDFEAHRFAGRLGHIAHHALEALAGQTERQQPNRANGFIEFGGGALQERAFRLHRRHDALERGVQIVELFTMALASAAGRRSVQPLHGAVGLVDLAHQIRDPVVRSQQLAALFEQRVDRVGRNAQRIVAHVDSGLPARRSATGAAGGSGPAAGVGAAAGVGGGAALSASWWPALRRSAAELKSIAQSGASRSRLPSRTSAKLSSNS